MRTLLAMVFTSLFFSCGSHLPIQGNNSGKPSALASDTLLKFAAKPEAGFNFEYLVYLPKGIQSDVTNHLLVETTNTGLNDTLSYHEKGARYAASVSSVGNFASKKLRIPLLVPIFPRSQTNWTYYTHALDRDVLLTNEAEIERLDLQLLAMVEDAKIQLGAQGYKLEDKFFMTGFSASGTFANRFTLLHPEKVKAAAMGGINGIATLPVADLAGEPLYYPLGIADLQEITGKPANLEAFRKLPQLLYMGELDDNDAVAFDDAYSEAEREVVYRLMGKQLVPERWELVKKVYLENKVQADFRTYPAIGHGTDLRINNEVVEFFRQHTN
ncbi:hypothetical protein Q4E40_03660 [Pontibacter sp. BT731]|uniref:hypothetical protein n=1 Tax=Pontibacter coccineus TaxID=3063328 RepID=UPI0026E200DB|nr:hypothetical protein [Pontibacter sp. BT731]MDO6389211.1 hypothetical protein [Pontibacter sp. BT731]